MKQIGERADRPPMPWLDKDKDHLAHRLTDRLGRRVRRLALRESVPLRAAAHRVAEAELVAAEGFGPAVLEVLGYCPAALRGAVLEGARRKRAKPLAAALEASAKLPSVVEAVPFPPGWKPVLAKLGQAAAARQDRQWDAALQATRDALAAPGTALPTRKAP
ncbi:hypothetical protein M0638_19670 [Roseomonas sp. NAR14]|uniref:Uncharacterized protein n=1 Tax=Roseomonas acroporae TaxID=2937791 RepID=A0A9X2BVE6_9PROT|nr:hypothetical protein [Roseomonas acroporae]MCK8786598.1 hypothetical protein [Roseomonas acroporae]